jgi:hypothetical protein
MSDKTVSRRPRDEPLTQQRLHAWQPILSPPWVFCGFFIMFLIFLGLGILILVETLRITEIEMDYTRSCNMTTLDSTGQPYCNVPRLEFNVTDTMRSPIYLYYKLENFYQNHRRYASSRSDTQLGGRSTYYATVSGECWPIVSRAASQDSEEAKKTENVYNPCGLVAWSMFNDTFRLFDETGAVICNGPTPNTSNCTKNGIAWDSDRNVKFKQNDGILNNTVYNMTYYNESGHVVPSVTDEDFIVWMRTAALPSFRKLHRIINVDLKPGTYYFNIDQNYPVLGFGGAKKVVLSTGSWIGGRNLFLAIAYLVVAGICAVLCVVFAVGGIVQRIRQSSARNV